MNELLKDDATSIKTWLDEHRNELGASVVRRLADKCMLTPQAIYNYADSARHIFVTGDNVEDAVIIEVKELGG